MIQHFCLACGGVLRVDLIPDTAQTSIIALEVTCKACGTAREPVTGVSFKEAIKANPSPTTRMILLDTENRARKKLIKPDLPPTL